MARPFYIIFAGVNGAGKTTLYRSNMWRNKDMPKSMARVNSDEILRETGGDHLSAADQKAAGKTALDRINQLFKERKSFNQETTLTGKLAISNVLHAYDLGYRIFVLYVGIESVKVALNRIENRVQRGGHHINEPDVRRRFRSSLCNFSRILDVCEQAMVFDNTRHFTCLAQWSHGMLSWWGNANEHGHWLLDAMRDEKQWSRAKP